MIKSLEELSLEVQEESGRRHIQEAIKCYHSGAYRASIVAAYVALCFDLIEKMRYLASRRDKEAEKNISYLEDLQEKYDSGDLSSVSGLLTFERNLLEVFRDKFDFFGRHEFDELARLREDRNRCAHPTFLKNSLPFAPTAELARLHIRNTLSLVLTQPPKQGKAALESLQAVVVSAYFPKEVADAAQRLKGSELRNAREPLIRAFVDMLCFDWAKSSSPLYHKADAVTALLAVIEVHRAEARPRAIQNINKLLLSSQQEEVEYGCALALRVENAGEEVAEPGRPALKSWLKSYSEDDAGMAVKLAMTIDWLKSDAVEALDNLEAHHFGGVSGDIPREMASAAAKLYSSAQNWSQANDYASRFAIDWVESFSDDDLVHIFAETSEGRADLLGSHGFKEFVKSLLEREGDERDKIVKHLKDYDLERLLPAGDRAQH